MPWVLLPLPVRSSNIAGWTLFPRELQESPHGQLCEWGSQEWERPILHSSKASSLLLLVTPDIRSRAVAGGEKEYSRPWPQLKTHGGPCLEAGAPGLSPTSATSHKNQGSPTFSAKGPPLWIKLSALWATGSLLQRLNRVARSSQKQHGNRGTRPCSSRPISMDARLWISYHLHTWGNSILLTFFFPTISKSANHP